MKQRQLCVGCIKGKRAVDLLHCMAFNELGLELTGVPIKYEDTEAHYELWVKSASKAAVLNKERMRHTLAFLQGAIEALHIVDVCKRVLDHDKFGMYRENENTTFLHDARR